jgi:tetratricopeptide (TPR) repeat protein/transglutaminase-like putative cysteine protease
MLVWRSCLRGRLWVLLTVLFALLSPTSTWASGDVLGRQVKLARERLRTTHGRPEAIAALAALVRSEDFLPPGQMAQVLRENVDGKLGDRADPLVASQASYLLSLEEDRRGGSSEAESRRSELGLMRDFWVVGPFDAQGRSGFGRVFPVEEEGKTIDPRAGKRYPGKERDVAWRRVPELASVQGALLVDAVLRPDSDAVAYLLTYVHSDRDRWAALRVGSPGPVKAWLGGNPILANDVVRPAWLDQDAASVHLARGTNPLLIKTVITRGAWRLFVRLTEPDGRRLAGVTTSAEVPARGAVYASAAGRPPKVRDLGRLLQERAERAPAPTSARAWLDQALYLLLVQSADSELRAVENAAKKAVPALGAPVTPMAAEALLLVGSVAREEDDRRAALERALPALASAEERASALAEISRLWRSQRRDDAAASRWRQAIALDPNCVQAQLALAREEQDAGMAASALARLSALPEDKRRLPLVQDALADVLRTLGRPADSDAAIRVIHGVRKSDVGVLRQLAASARRRGDMAEVARLDGEALHWRPDLTALVFDQASALESSGDVVGARAVFQKAIARLPDDAGLPDELGRLEARAGRFEDAVAHMRRSLELRPQNPSLRRYMEALAAARKAKRDARSVDDLVSEYAADGEALAREVLLGPGPSDDASAEILLDRTVVRVHGNGLAERFVQHLVHVRSERAARENQETWVRFEPGRQEVEIRKARVLRRTANGDIEISEATGRDERELSEPWYGLYYDTRADIVAFENLRAGDVVEVQYTVADVGYSNEFADYFGDFQMIADALPTRRWDYTLIAPKTRTFYFNQSSVPGLGPKTESRDTEVLYKFEAKNIPRVVSEPAMPGFAEVAPYLHVSTYRTWAEVGRWYWNLVADQMQDDGTLAKAAAQATAGLTTTLDKVKAIHRLVVEKTRYVGLEFGIHGYKPYKSTQVFQRRFGDCKDKATLIMTLLRSVGVETELVLLRTRRGGRIDEAPASLAVFDHAIAYVPALDLYLDGTAEFSGLAELPAEDQDTMALRVSAAGAKLVRTSLLAPESNLALRQWQVDLHEDGSADIAEELTVAGQAAHEWRSHYQTVGERSERYAKVMSARFAGAVLTDVTMDVGERNRPVTVRSTVKVPRIGERLPSGEMRLPTSSREADFTSTYARLGQRRWPLVLGYPWRHEEQVTYRLPDGIRVLHAPSARKIESPFGEFTLAVKDSKDLRTLSVSTVLLVTKNRIEPQSYAAFRAFLRDTDAALAERIVVGVEKMP